MELFLSEHGLLQRYRPDGTEGDGGCFHKQSLKNKTMNYKR